MLRTRPISKVSFTGLTMMSKAPARNVSRRCSGSLLLAIARTGRVAVCDWLRSRAHKSAEGPSGRLIAVITRSGGSLRIRSSASVIVLAWVT